jgi:hypothetical protein
MKTAGTVLIVFGALLLAQAGINAPKAPNVSYLVGTFLPGLLCLILGLKLAQAKKPTPEPGHDASGSQATADDLVPPIDSSHEDHARTESLKFNANLGLGCGVVLMFLGSGVTKSTEDGLLIGLPIAVGGWAWAIWGCVNYMRWKGHSGWFGLFGYLLLPGLLILACFPKRRKRLLAAHTPDQIDELASLSRADRRPGYRYLLTLAPLGVACVALAAWMSTIASNVDVAQWQPLAPPGLAFQALMPGSPRIERQTPGGPGSGVEVHKFTVTPKGKGDMFMIVAIQYPEDLIQQLGGSQQLLELGRQDLLAASGGEIKNEKQINLSGHPGIELEIIPPKGASIKARVYATENRLYQVLVHVPRIRLASADVEKFFDSFQLSAEPVVAAVP